MAVAKKKLNGFLLLASFIDRIGKIRPVAHHVRVVVMSRGYSSSQRGQAVRLSIPLFFLSAKIPDFAILGQHERLMLVSFKSTASASISFQTPNLSRILAMLGASWMPAPTES